MKKVLVLFLVLSFILGMGAMAHAKIGYGPLVVEDSSALKAKQVEIKTSFSYASISYNAPPPESVSEPTQGTPGSSKPSPPEPEKIPVTMMGMSGTMDIGVTDVLEIGVTFPYVSRSSDDEAQIPSASGLTDIGVKAKLGSEHVSATVAFMLPTGAEGLVVDDNNMDIAGSLAFSVGDRTGGFHANVGYTKWGADDTTQSGSLDYGAAIELPFGTSYGKPKSGMTMEFTGSTLKNQAGKVPMDCYLGLKIGCSETCELLGLVSMGLTSGSNLNTWGIGFGGGLRWVW